MLPTVVSWIVLSTIYNDTLYLWKPPSCSEAYITFKNGSEWIKLIPVNISGMPFLTLPEIPADKKKLKFRVKYLSHENRQTHTVTTHWHIVTKNPEHNTTDGIIDPEKPSETLCRTSLAFSIVSSILVIGFTIYSTLLCAIDKYNIISE